MSIDAISWVFHQDVRPATRKLVLLALADFAAQDGTVWSPLDILSAKTSLDRKTIVNAIAELEETGYLVDTKMRRGHTGQLKVYRLLIENHSESTLDKQYRKRNSTENGTVPFFPSNSTVFPHETVPKTVLDPLSEPLSEPSPLPPWGELLTEEQKKEDYLIPAPVRNNPSVPMADKPTVRESPKVQRTVRTAMPTMLELKPYYAAYRQGLNGTPCTEPVTDSQVKSNAKALQEMLDAGYTLEAIASTTAKINKSWNSKGKTYTVSPATVVQRWDEYFSPAKNPSTPRSAAPPSSQRPTFTPPTMTKDELRDTLRQDWEQSLSLRHQRARMGHFNSAAENVAYAQLSETEKSEARERGYVLGFEPDFDKEMGWCNE